MKLLCMLGRHQYNVREVHACEDYRGKVAYKAVLIYHCAHCDYVKLGKEMTTTHICSTGYLEGIPSPKLRIVR